MAMMNEILGVGARIEQLLTRKFNIIGGAPSPQLTPEVTPIFPLFHGPESRILAQERLMCAQVYCAGVAAKRSVIQLYNPPGTNVIGIVTRVWAYHTNAAANEITVGFGALTSALANPAAAGGITSLDGRYGITSGTVVKPGSLSFSYDTGPPTILAASLDDVTLAQYALLDDNTVAVCVTPGYGMQITTVSNQIGLVGGYRWLEVPMAPGELGPF